MLADFDLSVLVMSCDIYNFNPIRVIYVNNFCSYMNRRISEQNGTKATSENWLKKLHYLAEMSNYNSILYGIAAETA